MPIIGVESEQASDKLSPFGIESGLSVMSTSIIASSGLTSTVALIVTPSTGVPGKASCVLVRVTRPLGSARITSIMRFSL